MNKKFIFGLLSTASFCAMAQETAPAAAPAQETAPAMEQEKNFEVELSLTQTLSSKYVWRGIVFNENLVNQGDFTAAVNTDAGSFAASIWYNLDLHNENDEEWSNTRLRELECDITFKSRRSRIKRDDSAARLALRQSQTYCETDA